MTMKVNPIPEGQASATPYLCVKDATRALAFYAKAFGGREIVRLMQPDGRVGHAEIMIGAARIMLADEFPEMDLRGPLTLGGTPVILHLYVEDVDAFVSRAVGAGAKLLRPVQDQFYGDRSGRLADPFGHHWDVGSRLEDVSPEEMQRRATKLYGPG